MTPPELASEWATDPVAGVAHNISKAIVPDELAAKLFSNPIQFFLASWFFDVVRTALPLLVAILAATILFIATNAGLLGISRLAFSLGRFNLIPGFLGKVHHRSKTPYVSIIIFTLVAILLQVPGFFHPDLFENLGGLYAFGSMLSFALAHLSILALRWRMPKAERPFRLGWNVRFRDKELPVTAIVGLLGTVAIWIVVVIMQEYSRWVGFGWMALGAGIYFLFRWWRQRSQGGARMTF